jgi:putative component of toxin-antitoxin plasmid stabilization module
MLALDTGSITASVEARLLLLLAGGSKATQNKDIEKALEINRLFKEPPQ